jgi:hypothetical protein
MRDALKLCDLESDDSVDVRSLLTRAIIHPQYVLLHTGAFDGPSSSSSSDSSSSSSSSSAAVAYAEDEAAGPVSVGNRFASFVLTLSAGMVEPLMHAVREQLPTARDGVLRGCVSGREREH